MKWVKIAIYFLIYSFMLYVSKDLFANSFESIKNLNSWYVRTADELYIVFSFFVEILTLAFVIIVFFLPLSWNNRSVNNINYYLDKVYSSISNIIGNYNMSKEEKTRKWYSLVYDFMIFFWIYVIYIWFLVGITNEENWLVLMIYLMFIYIIVKIINVLTAMVAKLDLSDDRNQNADFLSKKNWLTFISLIIMVIFITTSNYINTSIYDWIKELPVINLFDWDRLITKDN